VLEFIDGAREALQDFGLALAAVGFLADAHLKPLKGHGRPIIGQQNGLSGVSIGAGRSECRELR
jgi:hypothetical protein